MCSSLIGGLLLWWISTDFGEVPLTLFSLLNFFFLMVVDYRRYVGCGFALLFGLCLDIFCECAFICANVQVLVCFMHLFCECMYIFYGNAILLCECAFCMRMCNFCV